MFERTYTQVEETDCSFVTGRKDLSVGRVVVTGGGKGSSRGVWWSGDQYLRGPKTGDETSL